MAQQSAQDIKKTTCRDKLPCIMRIFNLTAAAILLGFGIAGIVVMSLNSITSGKFFLIFSPIFMVYFTAHLVQQAYSSIQFIMRHFIFMKAYFGRGVFSVFMASTVFYYFSCGANNDAVGWIAAILIFLTGVFYIVAGTCMHKTFQPKELQPAVKQELIT